MTPPVVEIGGDGRAGVHCVSARPTVYGGEAPVAERRKKRAPASLEV